MSKRTRAAVGVALALALAVLAGCGSSHGPMPVVQTNPAWPTAAPKAGQVTSSASPQRPNVFVIETDDMRTDDLAWMPRTRRLIQDTGLTFENSFGPYPLCCPSRASFLSGEYSHNHGVLDTQNPYGFQAFNDKTTIATVLHKAGYGTGLVGKYLNGYGRMPTYGARKPSLHYVPPGWTDFYGASDHRWPAWTGVTGGTYAYFNLTQSINGHVVTWPGRYSTTVLAREARHVIGRLAARHRPWFVWWTPVAPHFGSPREPDDPAATYNNSGHRAAWETPARPNWVKGRFDAQITHGQGVPPHGPTEADMSDKPHWLRGRPDLNRQERYAEVLLARQRAESLYALDVEIGRTLRYLKRSGQYDDTVIVFTSDNGYYLGEHRKRQHKTTLHEPSLRVPLLITGPGVPRGKRYDPIATVDMAPTIAALAGVKGGMPHADGINMLPVIRHGDRGWRRPIVSEARINNPYYLRKTGSHGFNSELDVRGLRLGRWKLSLYAGGDMELYDLLKDPLEMHSLQDDPKHARIKREMMRLWWKYKDCAGRQCSVALPRHLQLGPQEEKRLTEEMYRRMADYYSDPAWLKAFGPSGPAAR